MRVIIAGSRDLQDPHLIVQAILAAQFPISTILHGACRGIDQMAGKLAGAAGLPVEEYPADWATHGKAAGPIRNRQMVERADALIAILDKSVCSHGTRDIIQQATRAGLKVHVHEVETPDPNAPPF